MSHAPAYQDRLSIEEAMGEILSALAAAMSPKHAAAFVYNFETGRYEIAATRGYDAGQRERLQTLLETLSVESVPVQRLVREHGAVHLPEPAAQLGIENWEAYDIETQPSLIVPMIGAGGQLLGALSFDLDEATEAHRTMAEAMGRLGAHFIEQAQAIPGYAEHTLRTQALLEMCQQMTTSMALPQVLAGICQRTVEAFGVSCATVFELDPLNGDWILVGNHGIAPDVAERYVRFQYVRGRLPGQENFKSGKPVVLSRRNNRSTDVSRWLEDLHLHTAAVFPLASGDVVYGALVVGMAEAREFTRAHLLDIDVVAHHATTAIVFARFLSTAENSARFRAAVSALAIELNQETDRARALRLLCARGRTIMRAAWGALLLEQEGRLVELAASGDVAGAAESISVSINQTDRLVVQAFTRNEIVYEPGPAGSVGAHSELAIPLAGPDGPVGVLLFRGVREQVTGLAGEARILGALAGAVLRNIDLLARLHTANTELRRANILKDQLLANASHDLRTPLNVIIGYGQLALEGAFGEAPADLQDVIQRMVNSACDQLRLVEDLLNLSRIELNILAVKPVEIPLAPLFDEMRFVIEGLVQGRPVQAEVQNLDPDVWIRADPDRLRQILTNLLTNASKFTEEGRIELFAILEKDRVKMGVRDTGIGIAPQHHRAIFEPFCQIDEKRKPSGAGLGLAIARRLTRSMQGSLEVESELGRGSTFWLTLPRANPNVAIAEKSFTRQPAAAKS